MSAKEAWDLLKLHTSHGGMIAKITALTFAIKAKFSDPTKTSLTIAEIEDAIANIYTNGKAPTQDEFTILVLMNGLQGTDLDWVCKHLLAMFSHGKSALSKKDVIETITLAGREKSHTMSEKANAAKSDRRAKVKCSNCDWNHPVERCWAKGGGAEDKAPEWYKEAQKTKTDKRKGPAKANVAADSTSSDSDAVNFSIDVESSPAAESCLNDG
jgi:hypothetical protein